MCLLNLTDHLDLDNGFIQNDKNRLNQQNFWENKMSQIKISELCPTSSENYLNEQEIAVTLDEEEKNVETSVISQASFSIDISIKSQKVVVEVKRPRQTSSNKKGD